MPIKDIEKRRKNGRECASRYRAKHPDKARACIAAYRALHPEVRVWSTMRQRCLNPNNHKYPDYGGRGITVCERWRHYRNFISDMGARPGKGWSIERIDNDGNYEPENCKWATAKEQRWNQRRTNHA